MSRKITDIISKPSEALQAMVDGLLKQSQRSDFKIDMSEWGTPGKNYVDQTVCYGCAATCTLQQLAGKDIIAEELIELSSGGRLSAYVAERAEILQLDVDDMDYFENCINAARLGDLMPLFQYFSIEESEETHLLYSDLTLETDNWHSELLKVEAHIKLLQAAGY